MKNGRLSEFIGAYCDEFYGGPLIKEFEAMWSEKFGCKHSISVNSNTSGLIAAMGAIGIGPGDEVIVPPWTMSASAMAPLFYGGIPVFVDIEDQYFCIDVERVKASITPKTKAIIAVNLFGHPAELAQLRRIADANGLYLVEDNAQAPLIRENNVLTGTIGHIGVASLNYHKHIHTGEGGVCTTNDSELAARLQLIRNHGENSVERVGSGALTNIVGYNFRLTEIAAAIGIEQIKKATFLVERRSELGDALSRRVSDLPGIEGPETRPGCTHGYYLWAAKINESELGVSRSRIAEALAAEGVPVGCGYVEPLYRLPVFKSRVAIGSEGYPFNLSEIKYSGEGCSTNCAFCSCSRACPTVEKLHSSQMIDFAICSYQLPGNEINAIGDAFEKVFTNIDKLRTP
jgi:dTDP-4-amino-4,6-dideoxygalactose transaminase